MFQELTGTEYIKCEIACKHDKSFEKENWDKRLAHFEDMKKFTSEEELYKDASNPIGLKSAFNAYKEVLMKNPTGYLISIDACSSGLQLLSVLSGCQKSLNLCGGDNTKCVDSYTTLYSAMNLGNTLTRKVVKNAIMTSLYGSTSTPEAIFADNIDVFYDTMETEAPGAWDLNIGLQELWAEIDGHSYSWVMPDNFHCHIETHTKKWTTFSFFEEDYEMPIKIEDKPKFHKGIGPNIIHSCDALIVREITRRCNFEQETITNVIGGLNSKRTDGANKEEVKLLWSHYKESGFLSSRILNVLDEETMGLVDPMVVALLIQELPDKPFKVISIHDCFKCHPNYGNDLRRQYNYIMAQINDSNMLRFIARQVTNNDKLTVNKFGSIPREVLTESNYMVC